METSLRYILFSWCRVPLVYLRLPKRPRTRGAHSVYQPVSLANKSTASDQLPECVVEMGGFEPPTSRVQGGRSPTKLQPRRCQTAHQSGRGWACLESNQGPQTYQVCALTD